MAERSRLGDLLFDHAIVAGADLDAMCEAFAGLGLEPDYGGEHAHGVTHNALLGFDDGSYVELMSVVEPGAEPERRSEFIAEDAGPCGWALATDDVEAVAERMADRGLDGRLSQPMQRETPGGEVAKWQLLYLDDGEPGADLPFVIEDRTPRSHRVPCSPSVAGSEVTGVAATVLGVPDLEAAVGQFRRVFDLPAPERQAAPGFGADLAGFPGQTLVLATPDDDGNWLADRVTAYGTLPCGFLLATDDLPATAERLGTDEPTDWFGRRVAWTALGGGLGGRLGAVESG